MILRIDDVCSNTDANKLDRMINLSLPVFDRILLSVSIGTQEVIGRETPDIPENIPCSDYRIQYSLDKLKVPDFVNKYSSLLKIGIASHGLVHVNHKFLSYGAQEMSIIVSCSVLDTNVFVPPYHHWNNDTEDICRKSGYHLIKYETGWKHCKYNKFNSDIESWYMHTHDFTIEEFEQWISK